MSAIDLRQKLIKFISKEIIDDDSIEVRSSTKLVDLGLESIEIMELVLFIENSLKCKLPTEFVYQKNIESVDTIVVFLERVGISPK